MLVEVRNLVKRYKDVLAVDNVSLAIEEGEILGLLGPNGAGKTTTINAMIGLTKADSGEIVIFGKNFKDHELEIKRDLGVVPQDIAIFEDLTAYENLSYFGKLYGLKGSLLKDRVEEALEFTGLLDKKKQYPKKFSNGMKRRLNIACALVHHPKLIIMDEPTVGIDPQSRSHIIQSIKKLTKMGSTIIYISHYMEEIEGICTRIVIMDHGRVIAKGTKEELKAQMTSDERVVVELSTANYTLIDNIKKLAGVKDAYVNGNELTVISQKNSKNLKGIIDQVSESSVIMSLNVEQPSLETVFLTLTGRSLRD
ncbi:ABC transporter ATP-binding protein [Desulfosporosinus sp. OT]|uniref:ABC transporter ATP-binding protein n=1 Tax=Desulfosporosinus sp. OT TaxID=913865 RepID=UPI000223A983|nr:ABC transporter ATP-binding protein [Desulfosporosinus sp. OT]EGW37028.1 ABC transporter family protein [Desulfosporosinus sp. OT]